MDSYDSKAWREINERHLREEGRRLRNLVPEKVRERSTEIVVRGKDALDDLPFSEEFQRGLGDALHGLTQAVGTTAAASVSTHAVPRRYRRRGAHVERIEDIQALSLATSDAAYPRRKRLVYMAGSGAEGGAAGLAMTVSQVGTAVGGVAGAGVGAVPGALAIAGIVAADTAATLAAAARIAAETSALYGYDPNDPGEELYMAGVIGAATAGSQGAKLAIYRELHQLAYELARRATWSVLNRNQITKVVQKVWQRLGRKLTQKQLGKAAPAIGVLIGGGANANLMFKVSNEAYYAYRERRLRERYDEQELMAALDGHRPAADRLAIDGEESLIIDLVEESVEDEPQ